MPSKDGMGLVLDNGEEPLLRLWETWRDAQDKFMTALLVSGASVGEQRDQMLPKRRCWLAWRDLFEVEGHVRDSLICVCSFPTRNILSS